VLALIVGVQGVEAPDFVPEITLESTYRTGRGEKRGTYADMGVVEYWQYDPAGSCLDPPLLGFRLVEGRYVPILPWHRRVGNSYQSGPYWLSVVDTGGRGCFLFGILQVPQL